MKMKNFYCLAFTLFILLLFTASCKKECEKEGISIEGISGVVERSNGKGVPFLSLSLSDPDGETFFTETDELGRYSFRNISEGLYFLSYEDDCSPLFIDINPARILVSACNSEIIWNVDYIDVRPITILGWDEITDRTFGTKISGSYNINFGQEFNLANLPMKNCLDIPVSWYLPEDINIPNIEIEPTRGTIDAYGFSDGMEIKINRHGLSSNTNHLFVIPIITEPYSDGERLYITIGN